MRAELRRRYHEQLRYRIITPGYRREPAGPVVRWVAEDGGRCFILWSSLDDANAAEIIRRERRYFADLGQSFEWKVYDYDEPGNLVELLRLEGFQIDAPESVMILALQPGHPLLQPSAARMVQHLTEAGQLEALIRLEEDTWQTDFGALQKRLLRDLETHSGYLSIFGIYHDRQLVSGAWMYLEPGTEFGSLWGGATRPEFRRRGYYTALLAARAQEVFRMGRRYLTVDARPMSRPILEKAGFFCIAESSSCLSPTSLESE